MLARPSEGEVFAEDDEQFERERAEFEREALGDVPEGPEQKSLVPVPEPEDDQDPVSKNKQLKREVGGNVMTYIARLRKNLGHPA